MLPGMMKANPWVGILTCAGLAGLTPVCGAEETPTSPLASLSATTLSGYVDTSAQWNMGTGNAHTPNYAFGGPGKADGFNLNVVKLAFEKPIDPNDGWAAGYRVDLIFGPDADALATQSSGIASDFGVRQAYVALQAPVGNGLNFKAGVWDTIIGYEVTDSINNPNFTRSYGYTIEPPTHTGLHAAYQFADFVSVAACIANTFGPEINERAFPTRAESYKTYMGAVTFTAPKDWGWLAGSTLSGCVINGFDSGAPGGAADQTSWYVGATLNTPVKGLRIGAAYDYAGVSGQPVTDGESAYVNVTGLYASYLLTEKLTLSGRGEYVSSDTTVFLARKLFEVTATLQYDLWANVVSRLEFRWDHAADGTNPYGGEAPADPGTKKNSYILLANVAYKF